MTILRPYHFPDLLPQYFDNLSTQIYSVFDIPELDPTMSFEAPSSPCKNLRSLLSGVFLPCIPCCFYQGFPGARSSALKVTGLPT